MKRNFFKSHEGKMYIEKYLPKEVINKFNVNRSGFATEKAFKQESKKSGRELYVLARLMELQLAGMLDNDITLKEIKNGMTIREQCINPSIDSLVKKGYVSRIGIRKLKVNIDSVDSKTDNEINAENELITICESPSETNDTLDQSIDNEIEISKINVIVLQEEKIEELEKECNTLKETIQKLIIENEKLSTIQNDRQALITEISRLNGVVESLTKEIETKNKTIDQLNAKSNETKEERLSCLDRAFRRCGIKPPSFSISK